MQKGVGNTKDMAFGKTFERNYFLHRSFLAYVGQFKKRRRCWTFLFLLLSATNIHHSHVDLYIKMKNVPKVLCQDLLPFWAPDNAAERWQMPMTDISASINIWAPAAPARLVGCPLYRNVLAIQPSGDLWTDKSLCISKSSLFTHSCYPNFGVIISSAFSCRNFKSNILNYYEFNTYKNINRNYHGIFSHNRLVLHVFNQSSVSGLAFWC